MTGIILQDAGTPMTVRFQRTREFCIDKGGTCALTLERRRGSGGPQNKSQTGNATGHQESASQLSVSTSTDQTIESQPNAVEATRCLSHHHHST